MSWRDRARKRDARREREDRDLPPSMRQRSEDGSTWPLVGIIVFVVVAFGGALTRHWIEKGGSGFYVFLGMLAFVLLFVAWNKHVHRSRSRKQLRGEREPDSVRWENGPER